MPQARARNTLEQFTLAVNQAGWRNACERAGLYGDTAVAAHLGTTYTTVYRVRTGRLAPGNKFIAAATMRLGRFDELFVPVERTAA